MLPTILADHQLSAMWSSIMNSVLSYHAAVFKIMKILDPLFISVK